LEDEVLEVLPGLGEPKYPPIRAEDFHTKITSKYYGDDYRPEDQKPPETKNPPKTKNPKK
jgi:hypothetical protein